MAIVPKRSDRASLPPPGAMSVTVGLIALFRDRGATLTPEHLSRMGRFTSDTHGRVTFRSKWLDLHTCDPSKN
ncbi:hypothetical protein IEQ34_004748 [Dendrobium chrysotoxum]|uniref:Uncharacterized protein n=1 Tax=Dendrobium chrysotoxum TaxID=161865 RepID=A0AAV7HJL8_DENCH|nr:hypothetical protein IEQ34_004748 [Dendrobium chrysotoxum]